MIELRQCRMKSHDVMMSSVYLAVRSGDPLPILQEHRRDPNLQFHRYRPKAPRLRFVIVQE
jgi:hypothetical protein